LGVAPVLVLDTTTGGGLAVAVVEAIRPILVRPADLEMVRVVVPEVDTDATPTAIYSYYVETEDADRSA